MIVHNWNPTHSGRLKQKIPRREFQGQPEELFQILSQTKKYIKGLRIMSLHWDLTHPAPNPLGSRSTTLSRECISALKPLSASIGCHKQSKTEQRIVQVLGTSGGTCHFTTVLQGLYSLRYNTENSEQMFIKMFPLNVPCYLSIFVRGKQFF